MMTIITSIALLITMVIMTVFAMPMYPQVMIEQTVI